MIPRTTLRRLALASTLALCAALAASRALAQQEEPGPFANVTPPTAAELKTKLDRVLGRAGGLTAELAAERATASSPSVRARTTRIDAAREEQTQALLGFVPRTSLTARYTRLSPIDATSFGPEGGSLVGTLAQPGLLASDAALFALPSGSFSFPVILDQYLLQASLLVPITDMPLRALRNYNAAKHNDASAALEVRVAERNAATNARLAYWEWVRLSMACVVAEQTVAQAEVQSLATIALEQAGKASPADVLQAKARISQANLMQARANNAAGSAAERLRLLMHDDVGADYAIGEDPTQALGAPPSAPLRLRYARAVKQRAEFAALDQQDRALLEQQRAARAAAFPSLAAFANLTLANPSPRLVPQVEEFRGSWDLGLQLSFSPNDIPAALSASSSIEARRRELVARRDELVDAVENEVREADLAIRDAQAALLNTESGILAAEEAYRIRVERFRHGRATQVELAESETALLRARLDRIEAQVGLRAATVRLHHALGE